LPSPPSPVKHAMQVRAGAKDWEIAIAVRPGNLWWSRCRPCRWPWCQGCPPPPRPCCRRPHPPRRQSLDVAPIQDGSARVHSTGHLCCRHTSSTNHGSNSALALLRSTFAHHHRSHYSPGRRGVQAMPPPWQACAGRWSSWPNLPCPRLPGAPRRSLQWCRRHRCRRCLVGRTAPTPQTPTAAPQHWHTPSAGR
jgi:hypothetical protein